MSVCVIRRPADIAGAAGAVLVLASGTVVDHPRFVPSCPAPKRAVYYVCLRSTAFFRALQSRKRP